MNASRPIRGITVAVGPWYARTLEICLVRNMRHLARCLVVTTPGDPCVAVARAVPGVDVFETDAFTRHGAYFNKGYALELGFDYFGRHGRILIWDADILLPDSLPLDRFRPGHLHGMRRRILENVDAWRPTISWAGIPLRRDGGPVGFTQLFDAEDPAIVGKRPWYDVSFPHGGGGDAYFLTHWPRSHWTILPVDVLHLGPVDRHWFGTDATAVDKMAKFVVENGWSRAAAKHDRTAVDRVGPLVERLQVPGYPPSDFELPFVRRTKDRRAKGL